LELLLPHVEAWVLTGLLHAGAGVGLLLFQVCATRQTDNRRLGRMNTRLGWTTFRSVGDLFVV